MIAYKPLKKFIRINLTLAMFFAIMNSALACTNPAANAGDIIYDDDRNLLSYCDGTNWIEVRGSGNLGYQANGIFFNGTDTRLTNSSPSGLTNSDKITGSLWFKSTDTFVTFLGSDSFSIAHTNPGRFIVTADNTLGTEVLSVRSSAGFLDFDDGSWYHVLFSFDLSDVSQNSAHIYINDQDVTNILGWTASEIMDFGGATYLNVASAGSSYYGTNIADMWVDFGTYIDFDVETNRRDFISAQGRPVSLGIDGSAPTGSAPEIFLSGNISGWETNKGTANGFTEEGTMVASSDSPSINDPTLIGHWKLDETSGTSAADSSYFGNSGTMQNGLDATNDAVTGRIDQGLNFDGSDDEINLGNSDDLSFSGTSVFTISAWVKPNGIDYGNIVAKYGTTAASRQYAMYVSPSNAPRCLREVAPFNLEATTIMTAGQWYHIACSYDGTDLNIYVNGTLENSVAMGSTNTNSTNVFIGSNANTSDSDRQLDAQIDDIRIYNRVLTDNEIQSLYAACQEGTMIYNADRHVPQYCAGNDQWTAMGPVRGGITNGLVGHWPLDETSGTTVSDASGNLNNGTMLNGLDGSTSSVDGKVGTSLDFDMPSDNRVQINAPSSVLDNIWDGGGTVSFWTYLDSAGQNQSIWVAKENSWVINNRASAPSVGIEFDIDFSGQSNSLWRRDDGIVVGEWTHVVITYNADSVTNNPTLYLNGTQIGLTEITTPAGTREDDAGANIFFGDNPAGTVSQDGRIDDVRFYNRMLTKAEIQALYSLGNNEDSSLVGHWKLDELSGTNAADSSGNSNTGTLTNFDSFPAWTSSGVIGNSLSFDGTDDLVNVGTLFDYSTTDFTIAGWINAQTINSSDQNTFFSQWGSPRQVRLEIDGEAQNCIADTLRLLVWDTAFRARCSNTIISSDTWYHIAVVVNQGGNIEFYINGINDGSNPSLGTTIASGIDNSVLGARTDSGQYFDGLLDDMRVYNRSLSAKEIDALYKLGIGNCTNPTGKEGDLIMGDLDPGVGTNNALMYCDGANWQAVGKTP